jgi:hypothetical protein
VQTSGFSKPELAQLRFEGYTAKQAAYTVK